MRVDWSAYSDQHAHLPRNRSHRALAHLRSDGQRPGESAEEARLPVRRLISAISRKDRDKIVFHRVHLHRDQVLRAGLRQPGTHRPAGSSAPERDSDPSRCPRSRSRGATIALALEERCGRAQDLTEIQSVPPAGEYHSRATRTRNLAASRCRSRCERRMTSLAKQVSCSSVRSRGVPFGATSLTRPAHAIMTCSSPGTRPPAT